MVNPHCKFSDFSFTFHLCHFFVKNCTLEFFREIATFSSKISNLTIISVCMENLDFFQLWKGNENKQKTCKLTVGVVMIFFHKHYLVKLDWNLWHLWPSDYLTIISLNRWYLGDFTKMEGTQMEMFNFLWLIWNHYLPLSPTRNDWCPWHP